MINKFKSLITTAVSKQFETQTSLLRKKAGIFREEEVECVIDEEVVDCEDFKKDSMPPWGHSDLEYLVNNSSYTGVPAPVYLEDDPWFGPAPNPTEKQWDYMEQETIVKMQEEMQSTEVTCESADIHAKMYEIATKNWTTVEQTPGGSENFQEGPGGWNSGVGRF